MATMVYPFSWKNDAKTESAQMAVEQKLDENAQDGSGGGVEVKEALKVESVPQSEFLSVDAILYATMRGEGNSSVVIFGRNGFGKSAVLSSTMHRIAAKCGKDAFIFIHLNALLHLSMERATTRITRCLYYTHYPIYRSSTSIIRSLIPIVS